MMPPLPSTCSNDTLVGTGAPPPRVVRNEETVTTAGALAAIAEGFVTGMPSAGGVAFDAGVIVNAS